MADEHFVHGFMETSAKEGTNVSTLFHDLAQAIAEIHDPKIVSFTIFHSKFFLVELMARSSAWFL